MSEDEAVSRKCMKAFECPEENLICVCIVDITQRYVKEQSRDRIARDSIEIAQHACITRDFVWQSMKDGIQLPVSQALEVLEAALKKEDADAKTYVNKAVKLLEKYTNTIDGVFTVSAMEKGEEFAGEDVIFTPDFVNDLRQMAALLADGITPEISMENNGKRVPGFVSDRLRLKQMLGNALAMMVLESANRTADATLDFVVKKETENEEGVFDLLFSVRAKGPEEAMLQAPGMVFVKSLVDCMNGDMQFASENGGTELSFRIPLQYADKETLRDAKKVACVTDGIGMRDFSAFRALVVDDDAIDKEIIVSKLKQYGLYVETATDGEEAMKMLLESPRRYYQIVFMKMSLPKKSGLDLTMELRELTRRDLNDITVVAVTANPARDKRLTALEHGMDHHLILPFNDIELREMLLRELEDIGPEEMPEKFGFRVLK